MTEWLRARRERGEFLVPRTEFLRAFLNGTLLGGPVVLPASATDPDAFAAHGAEFAIDRWADDGGRT